MSNSIEPRELADAIQDIGYVLKSLAHPLEPTGEQPPESLLHKLKIAYLVARESVAYPLVPSSIDRLTLEVSRGYS